MYRLSSVFIGFQASPASSGGGDTEQADLEEGAAAPTEDELAKHLVSITSLSI